jgi:hypothetical protein
MISWRALKIVEGWKFGVLDVVLTIGFYFQRDICVTRDCVFTYR